jgi:hypothetical protein
MNPALATHDPGKLKHRIETGVSTWIFHLSNATGAGDFHPGLLACLKGSRRDGAIVCAAKGEK